MKSATTLILISAMAAALGACATSTPPPVQMPAPNLAPDTGDLPPKLGERAEAGEPA